MSDLLERIRAAQVEAGERAVMEDLRAKGLDTVIQATPGAVRGSEASTTGEASWPRELPTSNERVSDERLNELATFYESSPCDGSDAEVALALRELEQRRAAETAAEPRDAEIKRLNELVANHEEVHRALREILARFNSEDTRVMARRAMERIEDLESDCTRLHKQFMEAKYGPESPVKTGCIYCMRQSGHDDGCPYSSEKAAEPQCKDPSGCPYAAVCTHSGGCRYEALGLAEKTAGDWVPLGDAYPEQNAPIIMRRTGTPQIPRWEVWRSATSANPAQELP